MWPELLFDLDETVKWVGDLLIDFGVDSLYHDFAPGSLVAVIEGSGKCGPTLAFRADMDALPITETPGRGHGSRWPGRMHACGHDGHTAILLAAARILSATRRFCGRCVLVFQPAEEGGAGARRMVEGGLFANDRFHIDEIYGLHNLPGLPLGHIGMRQGAIMAASDRFDIVLEGRGGHAALPHLGIDLVSAGTVLVGQVNQMVARGLDPLQPVVVSLTAFEAPSAHNVMASRAVLRGTARSLDPDIRDRIEGQLGGLCRALAAQTGARVVLDFRRGYDVTINSADGYARILRAARALLPPDKLHSDITPLMAAEDFSEFLSHRPGAFLFLGNGKSAPLHSDHYDFDDRSIATGAAFWIALMEGAAQ